MSHKRPEIDPATQVEHGKLQMLGSLAMYEIGMNLPETILGAGLVLSSFILAGYGLKDYLVGSYRHEQGH